MTYFSSIFDLSYRFLAIGGSVIKLCMAMYTRRLMKLSETRGSKESDQFGFASGAGCRDLIIIQSILFEAADRYDLTGVFFSQLISSLDLKKAFPSFFWELVLSVAAAVGIGDSDMFKSFTNCQRNSRYQFGDNIISIGNGLKEGDSASPETFKFNYGFIIDYFRSMRLNSPNCLEIQSDGELVLGNGGEGVAELERKRIVSLLWNELPPGASKLTHKMTSLRFADDTYLYDQVSSADYQRLISEIEKFETGINSVPPESESMKDYYTAITLSGLRENAKKRKIGNILSLDCRVVGVRSNIEKDNDRRAQGVWISYNNFAKYLAGIKRLTLKIRGELLGQYVRSGLLYAADARSWTVKEICRMQVAENNCLAKFSDFPRWKREWAGINLKDLMFRYHLTPTAVIIAFMQVKYFAHIMRSDDEFLPRLVLTGRAFPRVEKNENDDDKDLRGLYLYSHPKRRNVTFLSNVVDHLVDKVKIPTFAINALVANKKRIVRQIREKRKYRNLDSTISIDEKEINGVYSERKRQYYRLIREAFIESSIQVYEEGKKATPEKIAERRTEMNSKYDLPENNDRNRFYYSHLFRPRFCFLCDADHKEENLEQHFCIAHGHLAELEAEKNSTTKDAENQVAEILQRGVNKICEEHKDDFEKRGIGFHCFKCEKTFDASVHGMVQHAKNHADGKFTKVWKATNKSGAYKITGEHNNSLLECIVVPSDVKRDLEGKFLCRKCDSYSAAIQGSGQRQSKAVENFLKHEKRCKGKKIVDKEKWDPDYTKFQADLEEMFPETIGGEVKTVRGNNNKKKKTNSKQQQTVPASSSSSSSSSSSAQAPPIAPKTTVSKRNRIYLEESSGEDSVVGNNNWIGTPPKKKNKKSKKEGRPSKKMKPNEPTVAISSTSSNSGLASTFSARFSTSQNLKKNKTQKSQSSTKKHGNSSNANNSTKKTDGKTHGGGKKAQKKD